MEYKIKLCAVVAASLCMATACSNDADLEGSVGTDNGVEKMIVTASTSSRTALSGTSVIWNKSDAITLFCDADDSKYEFTSTLDEDSAATSSFEGEAFTNSGETYYALYPHDAANASKYSDEQITFTTAATQSYTAGTFASGAAPTVAKATDLSAMTFTHLFGFVKVNLKGVGTVKQIIISSTGDEMLYGDVTVDMSQDTPEVTSVTNGGTSITLDCGDGVELDASAATSFIIAAAPAESSSYTKISIVLADQTVDQEADTFIERKYMIERTYEITAPASGATPVVESVALVQGTDYIDNAFTLKGKMTDDGELTISDYGFFVGTTSGDLTKYSVKSEESATMDGDGNFSYTFTDGITEDTEYYYYPYVENTYGISTYNTESSITTGVLDRNTYTRDAAMAFTTDRLVYWMIDPITVDVSGVSTKLTFFDRNLGATKIPTSSDHDYDAVGNYYVWSSGLPQASPEMAKLLEDGSGFVGSSTIPSSNGTKWNGWGVKTYKYTALDTNGRWSEVVNDSEESLNPCPDGYRPPTMTEWIAAVNYYDIPVTATSDFGPQLVANLYNSPLKFCLSGNFSTDGVLTNVANILIWSDNSSYSGATPQALIISTQANSMYYQNKRENVMPVRCVRSEVVSQ